MFGREVVKFDHIELAEESNWTTLFVHKIKNNIGCMWVGSILHKPLRMNCKSRGPKCWKELPFRDHRFVKKEKKKTKKIQLLCDLIWQPRRHFLTIIDPFMNVVWTFSSPKPEILFIYHVIQMEIHLVREPDVVQEPYSILLPYPSS